MLEIYKTVFPYGLWLSKVEFIQNMDSLRKWIDWIVFHKHFWVDIINIRVCSHHTLSKWTFLIYMCQQVHISWFYLILHLCFLALHVYNSWDQFLVLCLSVFSLSIFISSLLSTVHFFYVYFFLDSSIVHIFL